MLSKPQSTSNEYQMDRVLTPVKQRGVLRTEFYSSKSTNLAESYDEYTYYCNGQSNYIRRLNESNKKNNCGTFHESLYFPYKKRVTLLDRISHKHTLQRRIDLQNNTAIKLRTGGSNCLTYPKIVKPIASPTCNQSISLNKEEMEKKPQEEEKTMKSRARMNLFLDKPTKSRPTSIQSKRYYKSLYWKEIESKKKSARREVKLIVESQGIVRTVSPREILKERKV